MFGSRPIFRIFAREAWQAHCKIALAQEALALTLQSSYLESLEASAEEIKEYEAERKALETRRYVHTYVRYLPCAY